MLFIVLLMSKWIKNQFQSKFWVKFQPINNGNISCVSCGTIKWYVRLYYTYMYSSMIYMYVYVDMYVDIALSIAQLLTILDADVDAELSLCLTSLHVGHLLILCKYQIVLRWTIRSLTNPHTHTHRYREREKEGERESFD